VRYGLELILDKKKENFSVRDMIYWKSGF